MGAGDLVRYFMLYDFRLPTEASLHRRGPQLWCDVAGGDGRRYGPLCTRSVAFLQYIMYHYLHLSKHDRFPIFGFITWLHKRTSSIILCATSGLVNRWVRVLPRPSPRFGS